MHARELAELAAILALHAPVVLRGNNGIPQATSEQYWTASKCRLDRWQRVLRELAGVTDEAALPATLAWDRTRPLLEEILVSELLTRIWTAITVALDRRGLDQDLEPIARNIYGSHLDVRRRLLALLAGGRVIRAEQAAALNQLRCRVERWGDMLLAHLAEAIDIGEFAFDAERARDFASDLDREATGAERRFSCQLALTSLRASFAEGLAERTPNRDLNQRIASAILGAFREELSDSTGLAGSLWLERLQRTASDTEGMIEELLRM